MKITHREIISRIKKTDPKSHKGTLGHALIIGGSYGKIGSVCLSAKAALRTGCGLATVFLPECGYDIIQSVVPEAMAITDVQHKCISDIQFDFLPQAIGIGLGMGQDAATQQALYAFLRQSTQPLVIDADALNILSGHQEWLSLVPKGSVLTPHPKEFERLIGKSDSVAHSVAQAKTFSARHQVVLVLKGAPTKIVWQNEVFENTTGNAALATAGSGDVLTGMITSLIAQSYHPLDAALIAVYLHGKTADLALPETGMQAFIASDIINYIGKAYLSLSSAQ
ncbi:ADP-dependent (S)-NAD(P)H-hydrate dehydratase [Flavobacterium longum]|uniref:NAD(P)H-hydrate dehydratase n=1 Tax=Flavobacterium longum TaxID=1299340 RepID=UPI0039EAE2C6